MKNGKNILIFILINIIAIGIAIVLPAIPSINCYRAYRYDIPKVGEQSFAENIGDVLRETDTYEARVAMTDALTFIDKNRGEIFYDNYVWMYVMFGMMLGISLIVIGIILKYKSENSIYSKAFITAGVIVVITYIYFLTILLQKNVSYVVWKNG